MRSLTYLLCVLTVMALAFWAYRENYATQAAVAEMSQVRREIAALREELGILRAEWAYLNRPDRLRELVDLNFERLQLVPLEAGQRMDMRNIDYPKPPPPPELELPDPAMPDPANPVPTESQP